VGVVLGVVALILLVAILTTIIVLLLLYRNSGMTYKYVDRELCV
jgi:hypothetical protein